MTGTQSATRVHKNAFRDQGGGGDAEKTNLSEKKISGSGNGGSKTDVEVLEGPLALKYGNYGDPFALAPYQLFLLLFDFIFNWTMDLAHEDPLAVLVIFIFQCLAVLVNLVLYMMASASQAMQVGLPRRVTVHHWLNLVTCLSYICLTGWWFIWALRKSWPSVSDQFSFTWPHTTNLSSSENVSRPTPVPLPPPPSSANSSSSNSDHTVRYSSTGRAPGTGSDHVKEHYTLWSAGFNALYVVHRTTAIFYYFVYMRATFLVLNTPTIEKFLETKKILLERFQKAQTAHQNSYPPQQQNYLPHTQSAAYHRTSERGIMSRRRSKNGSGLSSGIILGVDEYLSGSGGDNGARKIIKGGNGNSKPKRQVLWMDNEEKEKHGTGSIDKTKTISAFQSIVAKQVSSQKRSRLRRDKVIDNSESATATEADVHCVAEKDKQSDSDVDVDIERGYMRAGRVKREEVESD